MKKNFETTHTPPPTLQKPTNGQNKKLFPIEKLSEARLFKIMQKNAASGFGGNQGQKIKVARIEKWLIAKLFGMVKKIF